MCSSYPYQRRKLSDVASGLKYLHSRGVIHGDLKGVRDYSRSRFTATLILYQSNVVVDADGCARIMDFRPAMVILDVDSEQPTSDQHARSRQWSAPEVLEGGATSKATDIFSLAMVMIEVFTNRVLCVKKRLTIVSYQYRCSPEQLLSAILDLSWLCCP